MNETSSADLYSEVLSIDRFKKKKKVIIYVWYFLSYNILAQFCLRYKLCIKKYNLRRMHSKVTDHMLPLTRRLK